MHEKLEEHVIVRVTPGLKARIEQRAVASGLRLSDVVRRLLEAWASEPDEHGDGAQCARVSPYPSICSLTRKTTFGTTRMQYWHVICETEATRRSGSFFGEIAFDSV